MNANHGDGPWLVWVHSHTGRAAYYFADEDLAMQFAVKHSSQAVYSPIPF